MPAADDPVTIALQALDTMPQEVTVWEADFLDNLLRRHTRGLSPTQQAILARMITQYLHDELLAAEIYGQQRLF